MPAITRDRRYERTQKIAETASFLGFDALVVPSARWPCQNVVAMTEHLAIDFAVLEETEQETIDWQAWRKAHRR